MSTKITVTNFLSSPFASLCIAAGHQSYKAERGSQKAHNALALLGEFYHLLRINEQPIGILGQSLLKLLGEELGEVLQGKTVLCPALAKLVLTQITLNGQLFKKYDVEKLNPLLDTMRRVIVEADGKSRRGKAYLMLGLDLYYSNFTANAMLSLQKLYGVYLDESQPTVDPFDDSPEETRANSPTTAAAAAADAATNTSRTYDDQHVPEKRQRVEIAVQTEVAICDVFRAGPTIVTPLERASNATTCTNLSISRDDNTSCKSTPPSPSATNSSGTRKSKIDPRIRNMKIGRVYPSPVMNSSSGGTTSSPPRALSTVSTVDGCSEVAKLSIKNVTLHELAMMKENPSHLNRITNGYLDRLAPPSEIRCPSIKSSSEYAGKENESERMESVSVRGEGLRNGGGGTAGSYKKSPPSNNNAAGSNSNKSGKLTSKFQMEENYDTITYDASFFDDYVPHNGHNSAKSFLQFLENK